MRVRLNRVDLDESGISRLAALIESLRTSAARLLVVESDFIAPAGYAILEALRVEVAKDGRRLEIDSPPGPGMKLSFARIIGFGGVSLGSSTTIPLRRFERHDAAVGNYLMGEWAARASRLPSTAAEDIVSAVGEVFENAFTHSQSTVGAVSCGQYFPKRGTLHLSLVDLGVGIPGSLAQASSRREEEINPQRAIEWAFGPGNSSLHTSRGLGLAIFRDFMRDNGATLHVFSGRAYAQLSNEQWTTTKLLWRFPGTLVDLELPTHGKTNALVK